MIYVRVYHLYAFRHSSALLQTKTSAWSFTWTSWPSLMPVELSQLQICEYPIFSLRVKLLELESQILDMRVAFLDCNESVVDLTHDFQNLRDFALRLFHVPLPSFAVYIRKNEVFVNKKARL